VNPSSRTAAHFADSADNRHHVMPDLIFDLFCPYQGRRLSTTCYLFRGFPGNKTVDCFRFGKCHFSGHHAGEPVFLAPDLPHLRCTISEFDGMDCHEDHVGVQNKRDAGNEMVSGRTPFRIREVSSREGNFPQLLSDGGMEIFFPHRSYGDSISGPLYIHFFFLQSHLVSAGHDHS
jgi:hypothetical protein